MGKYCGKCGYKIPIDDTFSFGNARCPWCEMNETLREIRDLLRESAEREKHLIGLSLAAGGLPPDPGAEVPPDEPDQIGTVEWWVEDESLAPNAISPAYLRQVLRHYLNLRAEVARLTRERDEALDVLRIIDKHDDVEFGPTVESELLDRLNASLGRIYQGSPSIGDRLTAAEALAARYREALRCVRVGCPTAEEEAAARYGPNWRNEKIDAALAAAPSEEAPGE